MTFILMRMLLLMLIIGPITCSAAFGDTSIIVYRTDQEGFIAADSKMVAMNDPKQEIAACKIRVVKGYVFADSGILKETNGPFDVNKIMNDAIEMGGSFKTIVTNLEIRIYQSLPAVANQLIPHTNPIYGKWTVGNHFVEIVLAHASDGIIYIAYCAYDLSSSAAPYTFDIERMDCPGPSCPGSFLRRLGEYAAINRELDRRPAVWKELGVKDALNHLIELQAIETPEKVALPVSIIELLQNGSIQWAQKGACATQ
jgi:hypothetical protein